jgi:APA family basic amino acid/polyamine antiporter
MTKEPLLRSLGLKEATALVVGTVIGTGVFLKAAIMSQQVGSSGWVLLAWVAAGALSLTGALCYAELGSLFPRAGGEYVYLREAYGDLAGFLYGWMRFWIATPGSIAAYAIGAATFLGGAVEISPTAKVPVAIGLIVAFSALNCLAVSFGGRVQVFMTALKIAMILGLIAAIFTGASSSWSNLSSSLHGEWRGWSTFGTALIAALWAYDGWNNMPMAAGEIDEPKRTIPRALAGGMILVLILYGAVHLAYFYALPFSEVTSAYSRTTPDALPVATKAAAISIGPAAGTLLSLAFVLSALGAMNGSILTGARVPFAMARDGLFFSKFGDVSHQSRTPVISVLIQALIASALAMSGTFDQLTDYVVFASWIFYALAAASLFVFRRKQTDSTRDFSVPGYPILPLVFIACSALLLTNSLWTMPFESGMGLVFLLAGIPVFGLFQKFRR